MNLEKHLLKRLFYFVDSNMKLEKLSSKYCELIFNYYNSNKDHLEPWEPTREKNYYTFGSH